MLPTQMLVGFVRIVRGTKMVKRLDVDSTFGTAYLLEQDLGVLNGHLKDISERIYKRERKITTEMSYQRAIERVIRIKQIMELEAGK